VTGLRSRYELARELAEGRHHWHGTAATDQFADGVPGRVSTLTIEESNSSILTLDSVDADCSGSSFL